MVAESSRFWRRACPASEEAWKAEATQGPVDFREIHFLLRVRFLLGLLESGGDDGTRTRDLMRDRHAF